VRMCTLSEYRKKGVLDSKINIGPSGVNNSKGGVWNRNFVKK
jgi:hypothetical protein